MIVDGKRPICDFRKQLVILTQTSGLNIDTIQKDIDSLGCIGIHGYVKSQDRTAADRDGRGIADEIQ